MKTLLVVTRDQHKFYNNIIERKYENLSVFAPDNNQEIKKLVPNADIILASPPLLRPHVNQMKKGVWVQSVFAGIDALVKKGLRNDYLLTNVKNTFGPSMSEYVFTYILGKEKHVNHFHKQQQLKKRDKFAQASIEKKIIGILGTGSIGQYIAKIAKAFGMKTKGMSYSGKKKDFFDETFTPNSIAAFCSNVDYIINTLPNTSETFQFIDKRFWDNSPDHSFFINVGRGASVHDGDLINAINNKSLSGAVLDVFHSEPLPEDHIYRTTPNITITPHVSGDIECFDSIMNIFSINYEKYTNGQELLHTIDFSKGY